MLYTELLATLDRISKSIFVCHTLTRLGLLLQQIKIEGFFRVGTA